MTMLENILTNIVSDMIFLLLSVLTACLVLILPQRRKLLRFFGIKEQKRMVVYISNLQIRPSSSSTQVVASGTMAPVSYSTPGGAFGIDDTLCSYTGNAVVFSEIMAANQYRDLFNFFIPSLSDKSNLLGTILFSDVKVATFISPKINENIESYGAIIALGSPGYNAVSSYIERELQSQVTFSDENDKFQVEGIPSFADLNYGFVERVFDKVNNRTCFYIAGLFEESTIRASQYLIAQWKNLQKRHGHDKPFVIVLKFDTMNKNNWTLVLER
jgi:hypothetical protein